MFSFGTFWPGVSDKIVPVKNLVGPRVKLARTRTMPKTTQAQLAARVQLGGMQLDRVAISKIEMGHRQVTDREVVALARALGVSAAWLLGENGRPVRQIY